MNIPLRILKIVLANRIVIVKLVWITMEYLAASRVVARSRTVPRASAIIKDGESPGAWTLFWPLLKVRLGMRSLLK